MKRLLSFIFGLAVLLTAAVGFIKAADFFENPTRCFEETVPAKISDIGSPYKIYFSTLTNLEKHAYNAILTEISAMPQKIKIPNLDGFELENVFSALLGDNPELFFIARTCTLEEFTFRYDYFIPAYSMTADEYSKNLSELQAKATKIISTLTDVSDKWQTELEIHDYIIRNCDYKLNPDGTDYYVSSAYGALVNGYAACEGYSKGAKLLLDMAGVKSAVVSGDATDIDGNTVKHMWNAVYINGGWYYLDCTWDDPVSESDNSIPNYSYFNITSEMISNTHSDFSYDFNCTDTQENYHVKTGTYFTEYNRTVEKEIEDIVAKALDNGNGRIELRFSDKQAYDYAVEQLFGGSGRRIDSILSSVSAKTDMEFSNYFRYIPDDKQYVLTLVIELV